MVPQLQAKTVHVNGTDLAYVEQGTGDALVFVHGSLGDYRSWGLQLAPFAERYKVVAYSRRYHWPNAEPGDGTLYAVDQHAADLDSLIETLGLAPAHVVGSSYGAMTALTLAVQRPAAIRSLVLGEPPLLPWLAGLPSGPALLTTFMTTAFEPAAHAFERRDAAAGVQLFIDGVLGAGAFDRLPSTVRSAMLENAASMHAETTTPPERYFSAVSPAEVRRLGMPVLLVQGQVSPAMFGLIIEDLARCLPHAERVTIPAASHSIHTMNPQAYNETVLGFLAKH
jgi:non-heme chloroperoxidase